MRTFLAALVLLLALPAAAHERWAVIATDHREQIVAGQGGTIGAAKKDLLRHCHTHCQLIAIVPVHHEHRH